MVVHDVAVDRENQITANTVESAIWTLFASPTHMAIVHGDDIVDLSFMDATTVIDLLNSATPQELALGFKFPKLIIVVDSMSLYRQCKVLERMVQDLVSGGLHGPQFGLTVLHVQGQWARTSINNMITFHEGMLHRLQWTAANARRMQKQQLNHNPTTIPNANPPNPSGSHGRVTTWSAVERAMEDSNNGTNTNEVDADTLGGWTFDANDGNDGDSSFQVTYKSTPGDSRGDVRADELGQSAMWSEADLLWSPSKAPTESPIPGLADNESS